MTSLNPYCSICPRRYSPLPADGPTPADILIVGERPGENENKYQRVFIGKTGEELNETYLPLGGLDRSNVRITNAVRCWADGNRTPTVKEISCCAAHHLPAEIKRTRPSLIILMGGSACKLVPTIKLDTHHGIPQWGQLFSYEGWLLPMYHPALGLHESRWMTQLLEDWERLGDELGLGLDSRDNTPQQYDTDYRIVKGSEVNELPLDSTIAVDTESHGKDSFSVQVSSFPGMAFMVLAEDRRGLALLDRRLRQAQGIFHNAVHDLDQLTTMGLAVRSYRDTMQEAYHLGNLPQALKPLTYRLFGYTMTSWEDVVRPYSIEALTAWIVEAIDISKADLSLIEVTRLKTKIREVTKKGPLEQLLNRLLQHTDKASDYDPWERLDAFWFEPANEWMTTHIEARIGKYPILGIANAPLAKAITYACSDADWTGQVATELERRRSSSLWQINLEDTDK